MYLLAQGKTALGVLKACWPIRGCLLECSELVATPCQVGRKRLFVEAPFRSCELADAKTSIKIL